MKKRWLCVALVGALAIAADLKPDGKRWWSYVSRLAGDSFEGRNTGSAAYQRAAVYVADQYQRAGLKPAGVSGYFQPVKFKSRRILEDQSSLILGNRKVALGEDATISMRVDPAESVSAPLVFVGYGLAVPEKNHNDLTGDLRGKIAVYITGAPPDIPGPLASHYQSANERGKFLERAGVIGTCIIQNPDHMDVPWARSALARFQPAMSLDYPDLDQTFGQKLAVTVNPARADLFLQGSGHSFQELLALIREKKPLPHFPIPGELKAAVHAERTTVESPNIAGVLPGNDPKLKNEYVVLSAHLDHVGAGEPILGDKIYNGAMDDASGVAALLDIADTLHESGKSFRRSLLFLTVTAEEKGLLGSRYFAAHPAVDRKSIVAGINSDMFLPLFPLRSLIVYGLNESDLGKTVREVVQPLGIRIQDDPAPLRNIFIRSDQYSFIRQGIPSVMLHIGFVKGSPEEATEKKWLQERYHAPSDDVNQPVDVQAAADFNRVVMLLAEAVANRTERPAWNSDSFFRRFAQ